MISLREDAITQNTNDMTSLKLIKVDPDPQGVGLPASEKIVAVSSSYSALVDYCEKTFGKSIAERENQWDVYYIIEPTSFVIVPEV